MSYILRDGPIIYDQSQALSGCCSSLQEVQWELNNRSNSIYNKWWTKIAHSPAIGRRLKLWYVHQLYVSALMVT